MNPNDYASWRSLLQDGRVLLEDIRSRYIQLQSGYTKRQHALDDAVAIEKIKQSISTTYEHGRQ